MSNPERSRTLPLLVLALALVIPGSAAAGLAPVDPSSVEYASGILSLRRVGSFQCTETNHTGSPVNVTMGILDRDGAVLEGPVECPNLADGATCIATHDVRFPVLDQDAWCHSVVTNASNPSNPVAMRGNFTARDSQGKTHGEEDLRSTASVVGTLSGICQRTFLVLETRTRIEDGVPVTYTVYVPAIESFACKHLQTAVIGGPRVGSLTCSAVNLAGGSISGTQLSLHHPDGSLLAGPLDCDPLASFASCRLTQDITFPNSSLQAYCTAQVRAGVPVVGNLTYEDWTHISQASSPLQDVEALVSMPPP